MLTKIWKEIEKVNLGSDAKFTEVTDTIVIQGDTSIINIFMYKNN
jgi:hypothetical protein